MTASEYLIRTYNIKEVHAGVGRQQGADAFFVYTREDVPIQEKMFKPARSSHFSIHLNLEETLEIKYNLINYTVAKNSLFIIHPGVIHALQKAEELPSITMGFTQDFFSASMLHKKHAGALHFLSLQSDPLFELTEGEAQTLYPQMLYLKNMLSNDHPFKDEMIHHGFNLFMLEVAAIAKKYRGGDTYGTTRKEDILLSFLRQLAAHFKEERSVQFYADTLFITPKHLTKTVKELTTKTCGDLIDEMVIAEARILLSDHSHSVGQVADHLHFSDQFFFSKFFKRRTGLSPKEYKNSL